jgi:hypothetical protein
MMAAFAAAPSLAEPPPGDVTRKAAFAGTWYPAGHARLLSAAHFLMRLAGEAPTLEAPPVALVVPHAGWNRSGLAAAAAYRLLRPGDFDRVVAVGPAHQGGFHGYALADTNAYETPLGRVPVCPGTLEELAGEWARPVPGVSATEYAIEVELPFLQAALGRFCLVPVLVGDTGPDLETAFADRLARLDDGRTLFLFSSDFLHYGPRYDFTPYGSLSPATLGWIRAQDRRALAHIQAVEAPAFRSFLEESRATICGRHGLLLLLKLLPRIAPGARSILLAHYLSADLPSAQDDASVSYVALAFVRPSRATNGAAAAATSARPPLTEVPSLGTASDEPPALSPETGSRLVRLARATLMSELRGTADLARELEAWPAGPDQNLRQGVYVSLYEKGTDTADPHRPLRGCIGQPEPVLPLYYGTVRAALDAALHDPRHAPVTAAELDGVEVEVTVVSPRRRVGSWRDIHIGTDGIVIEKDDRTALFLPQAAAAYASLEDALTALSHKAGLPGDAWRDGATFSVFRGQAFAEGR